MTTDKPPLCDAAEFAELMAEMVTDDAPRVFAVVEELGTRVDARVAGWGLAYADHVDVIGVDGGVHLGAAGPENILRRFGRRARITAHIVWPTGAPDGVAAPAGE
jgi:hypothetical protein